MFYTQKGRQVPSMATDYMLFIHGVDTRSEIIPPTYADPLIALIKNYLQNPPGGTPPHGLDFETVALYWGDVNKNAEQKLVVAYRASPLWEQFWFRQMRETAFLEFAGDIALYMSPSIGARVVKTLSEQTLKRLPTDPQPDDRLHLVGHSLGTVILFDVLFSTRWDQSDMPGYTEVKAFRETIYGVEPHWEKGIPLASIITMGSPLGLFSLMDVPDEDEQKGVVSTHDISPRLQQLFERLRGRLGGGIPPWINFAHPGDPAASPLKDVVNNLVGYSEVEDILAYDVGIVEKLAAEVSRMSQHHGWPDLSLLDGLQVHNAYWQNEQVALKITQTILEDRTRAK